MYTVLPILIKVLTDNKLNIKNQTDILYITLF